jgi:hypothetical protein
MEIHIIDYSRELALQRVIVLVFSTKKLANNLPLSKFHEI